ncbi:hypothetical protein Tco_1025135 [Tanacetum coccineum]
MTDLLLEKKLSQSLQALCEKLNKNVQAKQEEKNVAEEQATKVSSQYWKPPIYYDDDEDDEESSISLRDIISELPLSIASTPDFPITDSLIMKDEHLDTIPETESNEENKSSVEHLNLTPSESEDLSEDLSVDLSDIESECDMPVCDDFLTFYNPLFDSNDDFTSSDDESLSDEDIPNENFKIYSNPLFDEEIISTKIDPHHFNVESDLIESLLNRDTSIVSSPKFDSLLEEFSGELAHIDLISLEIDEADFDPEEEIRLVEKLLYDNSSPRPPEELNSENLVAEIESSLSISYPLIDTLLPFSSENEDKVVNPGILAAGEEKSPHLLSHRGFKAFQLISESPMMIYGGDIPILDVSIARIFEASRARGFCPSFTRASYPQLHYGNPIS